MNRYENRETLANSSFLDTFFEVRYEGESSKNLIKRNSTSSNLKRQNLGRLNSVLDADELNSTSDAEGLNFASDTEGLSSFAPTALNSTTSISPARRKIRPTIRFYRYVTMISVHLFFVLSYRIDIQIVEGDITASRFLGFHLCDPFMFIQVLLARGELHINLLIGAATILAFYALFAGRAFCAWICPYNFFGEIGEALNAKLIRAKIIKKREFLPHYRYVFLAAFCILTLLSGHLFFEAINPVGIASRFVIYGFSAAVIAPVSVFLGEVFFARRFWCRYVCPIGAIYSLIARARAAKIAWNREKCDNCGVCIDVCLVPEVIIFTKRLGKEGAAESYAIKSGDCTLCGRCIDVCHRDALSYENRLKKLL